MQVAMKILNKGYGILKNGIKVENKKPVIETRK